ncbi:hypothetical protein [Sabulibacter ruber]|nr:hypothetical protein [Sabulibacter ruber]
MKKILHELLKAWAAFLFGYGEEESPRKAQIAALVVLVFMLLIFLG